MKVSCSKFRAHVADYLDIALTEPLIITRFARDRAAIISAEVFRAVRGYTRGRAPISISDGVAVTIPDLRQRYLRYEEIASHNPILIMTDAGLTTVLLSLKAFDILFEKSLPKHQHAGATIPKITSREFSQRLSYYLRLAQRWPIVVTRRGREKIALLSVAAFHVLHDSVHAEGLKIAHEITFNDLNLRTAYYQSLSVKRPVLVASNRNLHNVIISAEAFRRLFEKHGAKLKSSIGAVPLTTTSIDVRDRYTYEDVLPKP